MEEKEKRKPVGAEEAGGRGSQTKNLKRSEPSACFPSRSKEAQSGAGSARHRPPPGSRKPGEPQGRREGGAGRRRRRPPAGPEEAEGGWGRRVRPPLQDAATMDGGPDPSRPRAGCGAGRPSGAREAAVASRRVALAPAVAGPATRAASPGPGLRSPALLAAVETMEGGRAQARPAPPPLPAPPPAGLTPSRPLRRRARTSWGHPPCHPTSAGP